MKTIENFINGLTWSEQIPQQIIQQQPTQQWQVVQQPQQTTTEQLQLQQEIQQQQPQQLQQTPVELWQQPQQNEQRTEINYAEVEKDIDSLLSSILEDKKQKVPEPNQEAPITEQTKEIIENQKEISKNELDKIEDLNILKEKYQSLVWEHVKLKLDSQAKDIKIDYLEKQIDQERTKNNLLLDDKKTLERNYKVNESKKLDDDLLWLNDNYRLLKESDSIYNKRKTLGDVVKLAEKITWKDMTPYLIDYLKIWDVLSEEPWNSTETKLPKSNDSKKDEFSKYFY